MLSLFHNLIKNNNKMKYIDLINNVKYPIFSLHDLKLLGEKIYSYQLSQWVKKGYLLKLKNGLFALSEKSKELRTETVAFNLYQPSYVSLEWALAKYGLIPEMVYNCTSVTTKTTRNFKNKFGNFIFRSIKESMFFGYKKIEENEQIYLIAEPEKALVDYVYLNIKKINNQNDIDEIRLNKDVLKKLDKKKVKKYAEITTNKKAIKILDMILC